MSRPITESLWQQLTEEITREMREWRLQHPKATLREIETELDARLAHMRARMLEDLALESAAADWKDPASSSPPACPQCGSPLQPRGLLPRTLQTQGGQSLTLKRRYAFCPLCETGLFPP